MKDNQLILKLRRQYSKDEVVALLNKRIKELELENGILKSEVSESKDLLGETNLTLESMKGAITTAEERKLLKKQYSQDLYVDNLKKEINSLRKKLREEEKDKFKYRDIVISKKLLDAQGV